jgi:hypothetical protein
MIPPIYFNVEEARKYLIEHGEVYTIRKERHAGFAMARCGSFMRFDRLGTVNISPVLQLRSMSMEEQLKPFVAQSGFESVARWMHGVPRWDNSMFLYYVKFVK